MADRNDRDRVFDWRDDEDRERWERENEGRWARDRGREWEWDEASDREARERWDWERGVDRYPPMRREGGHRFGRWYGRFGRPEGVGSASGYSGMGGPGWTPGGYGDPGYTTSGFANPDYGTSRTGRGETYSPSRQPFPVRRPDYESISREGRGDQERWPGPHTGRGPKGYQRGDERIHEDVSERLMDDGRIDATNIEVTVTDSEVTLSGVVESRRIKRLAEDIAESVRGVRDVHNHLRVGEREEGDREMSLTPEAEQLNRKRKR